MAMESEVFLLILVGFALVFTLSFFAGRTLIKRTEPTAAMWFYRQQYALLACFVFFICSLFVGSGDVYLSGINPLIVGCAGICWAISVLFMLVGIYQILSMEM